MKISISTLFCVALFTLGSFAQNANPFAAPSGPTLGQVAAVFTENANQRCMDLFQVDLESASVEQKAEAIKGAIQQLAAAYPQIAPLFVASAIGLLGDTAVAIAANPSSPAAAAAAAAATGTGDGAASATAAIALINQVIVEFVATAVAAAPTMAASIIQTAFAAAPATLPALQAIATSNQVAVQVPNIVVNVNEGNVMDFAGGTPPVTPSSATQAAAAQAAGGGGAAAGSPAAGGGGGGGGGAPASLPVGDAGGAFNAFPNLQLPVDRPPPVDPPPPPDPPTPYNA